MPLTWKVRLSGHGLLAIVRSVLTERDHQILRALTLKVSVLTLGQIARTWWSDTASGRSDARRRLLTLQSRELVERRRLNLHPELELEKPLCTWRPGAAEPAFGSISNHLKSRWTKTPRPTPFYTATHTAVRQFGGPPRRGGGPRQPHHVVHDLHVAALYLRLLGSDPEAAVAWCSEDVLKVTRRGEKLPDAVLVAPGGRERLAIEFGGQYMPSRLRGIHRQCSSRLLPYELW